MVEEIKTEEKKPEVGVVTNAMTEAQKKMLMEQSNELRAKIERGDWDLHQMVFIIFTYLKEKDSVGFNAVEDKFKQGLITELEQYIERAKNAMVANVRIGQPAMKDGKPVAPPPEEKK